MVLSKETTIDKIEVLENGIVQIRQATRIIEDGIELTKTYHRWSLRPGDDISQETPSVQSICQVIWTPEVIESFNQAKLDPMKGQK